MIATNHNFSRTNKFSYTFLVVLFALLFAGCGERRSGPGYSMTLPDATVTPAPSQTITTFRQESLSAITTGQDEEIVTAVIAENQAIFVALAQSGLWMGVKDAKGNYTWSRPQALPVALTTDEISALSIDENELWIGTHNSGLFRQALDSDKREWINATVDNSDMPSNTVNRIRENAVMTTQGIVFLDNDNRKVAVFNSEVGLLDNNTLDEGYLPALLPGGGENIVATESGAAMASAGPDRKFSRLSGGMSCHFEHVSHIYPVVGDLWLFIDQKDPSSPNGWRVAGICAAKTAVLVNLEWAPVVLDGVVDPTARIATHYQDSDYRVWIAFSADATHPQPVLASRNWQNEWIRYLLPAEISTIQDDAVMLLVGKDLWMESSESTAFTVLENVVAKQ